MAIFPGVKGGDILAWRGVAELVSSLQGTIAQRMTSLLPGEEMELLRRVEGRFSEALATEERFAAEFARLAMELKQAEYEDELPGLHVRFTRLVADYFQERGSVLALHALCSAFRDELIRKALHFAEQAMEPDPYGAFPDSYCWLVGGAAGRGEQSLRADADYFLVYRDVGEGTARQFEQFSYRVMAALERCGLMSVGQRAVPVKRLWRGSVEEWHTWQEKELRREVEPRLSVLCRLADLRPLHGGGVLCTELAELIGEKLRQEASSASFHQVVKAAVGMPVALGMFGGFRVERSGAHKGCFDLEQLALAPLAMNVRALSIAGGLKATGTVGRIKRLLEEGRLDVALAERLLMAFHEFCRHLVRLETAAGRGNGDMYLNPDDLAESDRQKLKDGMEAVVNLQKINYQSFLGSL